ncbi:MAG TPA: HEPN domain-containing protein [Patescibacteria group bacterium]|nr:HEPN domain-containing protein [Patescibacteria group bacterium]
MTAQDLIAHWQTTAQDAFDTAEVLLRSKRYDHALFFCHLAIEKLLKGLVVKKTNTHPLPIHALVKLATQADIALNQQQRRKLEEITKWNIQARYDSIKRELYHKATREFTIQWMATVNDLFVWLTNQY